MTCEPPRPPLHDNIQIPDSSALVINMTELDEERAAEVLTLKAIYGDGLVIDKDYAGCIDIPVVSQNPVQLLCDTDESPQHSVSHLPPVRICFTLPGGYPSKAAPMIRLQASWLPDDVVHDLQKDTMSIWEQYGHTQALFACISQLEEAAEQAFGISALEVNANDSHQLTDYDHDARRKMFEQETFECGICLDPKSGSKCHQMESCRHAFCVECLQGCYHNAILTGNISNVSCPAVDCGSLRARLITPRELLHIPIERPAVQRYVDLKWKKKLESDKTTVWCPRQWCQSAAQGNKYPRPNVPLEEMGIVFEDQSTKTDHEQPSHGEEDVEDEAVKETNMLSSRLQICEDCSYAFCRLCSHTWHGDFFDCRIGASKASGRTVAEIEEEASLDFIRQNTSKCPRCEVPVQKSEACNHMICAQCRTHFCYLCSDFLNPTHPYAHFNKPGSFCHQRLWEGHGGEGVNR